ncbi:MAG TPA: hypothetical protein VFY29_12000 [Terriglobia bacterium]|nr:hypothetical protein [Terriglobia bacterium]
MRRIVIGFFVVCVLSVPAFAQVTTSPTPGETYFPVIQFTTPPSGQCLGSSLPATGAWCFALSPADSTVAAGVPTGLLTRALRLTAISAALQDAIPNGDDRFAIRLNAAGFRDYVAGAVGFSANIGRATRFSVNYGRTTGENAVSGGVNFSFR